MNIKCKLTSEFIVIEPEVIEVRDRRVTTKNQKGKRKLRAILAGSIRTPSRVWHFNKDSEGKCLEPTCQNCTNNAEHMFWECPTVKVFWC